MGEGEAYVTSLRLPVSWYGCFSEYIQRAEDNDAFVAGDDVKVVCSSLFHFCQFTLQLPQRNS